MPKYDIEKETIADYKSTRSYIDKLLNPLVKVTFLDFLGNALSTEDVMPGTLPTPPTPPTVDGHDFTGWQPAIAPVYVDTVYRASYAIKTFTVTFLDWLGTTLKTETVNWGDNATPPEVIPPDDYVFTGWDGSYTNIKEDKVLRASIDRDWVQLTSADFTSGTYNGTAKFVIPPVMASYTKAFYRTTTIEAVDFTGISNYSMGECFREAGTLGKKLDVSTLAPSIAINMDRFFQKCNYSEIDISGLDAGWIASKNSMFYEIEHACTVWCKDEAAKTALSTGTNAWPNVIYKIKGVD